jgi:hypothetical protein
MDDYLIDRDRWQRAKQQLIERAGLEGFVDPQKTLKELDEALYQQYLLTDRNIAEGKNPHIKFKKNGGCRTVLKSRPTKTPRFLSVSLNRRLTRFFSAKS